MKSPLTWVVAVVLVAWAAFIIWAVVSTVERQAACEEAGGVQVRGACIDRDVVIKP